MSEKKNDVPEQPVVSVLVVEKKNVIELIHRQMVEGDRLLEIEVPVISYVPSFLGKDSISVEYEKEKELEFFNEYNIWNDRNREIFTRIFLNPNNQDKACYDEAGHIFFYSDTVNEQKSGIKRQISFLDGFLKRIDLIPVDEVKVVNEKKEMENAQLSKKIFIVHGHDEATRNEVELFVRSIGYEPIILCKQADLGNTIIEKIERESKDVCFAIVIYTFCDEGKARDEDVLKPRARQNVVFEHGFMCSHLGRSRVCALLESEVEQPGDLQGVIYKTLDQQGLWKYSIAKEMNAVGLEIDMNKIS